MSKALLDIRDLHVRVEEKEILHGVDLTVGQDETHVLMGPNGTGKSTLGYAITGNPAYSVTEGSIIFNGEDITYLPVNERAKKGIFLSFQNPLEVPGVTLSAFIRSALEQKTGDRLRLWDFKKKLKETMALLNMDESYAERDLNVGFSGGEKKKAEILQMLMLEPKLAILDETDSGLDVDAVRTVSEGVRLFRERTHGSLLIITHSTRILEALHVDAAHVMEEGVIVRNGGAELVDEIIVATREDLLLTVADLCGRCGLHKPVKVVRGGSTRAQSVLAAALEANPKAGLLAVHDAARPLVDPAEFDEIIRLACRTNAAAPAVPVTDTIKAADPTDGRVLSTPDRSTLFAVYTPQVIEASLLKAALQSAIDAGAEITDDCSAVERLGKEVYLATGSRENIKITTPLDLLIAEAILRGRDR